MPIYEYLCNDCGCEFEELVTKTDTVINCPSCRSVHADKLISCCRSRRGSGGDSGDYGGDYSGYSGGGGCGGGCGSCVGGNCASCR